MVKGTYLFTWKNWHIYYLHETRESDWYISIPFFTGFSRTDLLGVGWSELIKLVIHLIFNKDEVMDTHICVVSKEKVRLSNLWGVHFFQVGSRFVPICTWICPSSNAFSTEWDFFWKATPTPQSLPLLRVWFLFDQNTLYGFVVRRAWLSTKMSTCQTNLPRIHKMTFRSPRNCSSFALLLLVVDE